MNVYVLLGVIALVALIAWVGTKLSDNDKSRLSSGKVIPDEEDLCSLSLDRLMTGYTKEELEELAEIANSHCKDESERVREQWEDFLGRICEASEKKYGVCRS